MSSLLKTCLSWLPLATALITKQSLLTPQTLPQNDSFLTLNPYSVTTVADSYYLIRVDSQDSYDIKLSLDSSYGFDSSFTSTFTFTINGFTPFIDRDTDILFVFSVGNMQYFGFLLHLDEYNQFNKIYTPSNYTQNVSDWISNANNTINSRYNRISNNKQWITLNQHQSLWPLKFVITNDPYGHSTFEFYHSKSSTLSVTYEFETLLFEPNKEIDIYLSGESVKEQFYISSFDILSSKNLSTYNSTITPTIVPTPEPTFKPIMFNTSTFVYIAMTNNTNSITNLTEMTLSESITETEIQTNKLFINNTIKSQAIIVIIIILIVLAVLGIIIVVLIRYCKPVKHERKDSHEIDDDENNTDSESNNMNEYMNEGILSPNGLNGVNRTKQFGFVINTNEQSNKNSIGSRSVSIDNNENSSQLTVDANTVNSDDTNIIPLHEKQNMDKFIKMINDKRENIHKLTNNEHDDHDNKQVISRKVSDEINYCVSFNYCDSMLS